MPTPTTSVNRRYRKFALFIRQRQWVMSDSANRHCVLHYAASVREMLAGQQQKTTLILGVNRLTNSVMRRFVARDDRTFVAMFVAKVEGTAEAVPFESKT
jgi:hypothetical protein